MRSPGEALLETRVKTLVLPIQLLSKNGRDKLHFRQRNHLRKSYQGIILLKYPRKHSTPDYKQRMTVMRLMGPRERDFDEQNLIAGSAIELIDSFVHLGWLKDDSPPYLEPVFKQGWHKMIGGPAVVVTIEVLP